jgi:hypothetical protein
MPTITAVVHTENDALRLGRCLETLYPCDGILVVDHGSRDGTVEVAREYGARVSSGANALAEPGGLIAALEALRHPKSDAAQELRPNPASAESLLRPNPASAEELRQASPDAALDLRSPRSDLGWILCLDPRESISETLAASLYEWKTEWISPAGNAAAFSMFLREETAEGWVEVPAAETRLVPANWGRWQGRLPASDASSIVLEGELLRFAFP